MPGKWITDQQLRIYMSERNTGHCQNGAAAKAGISERSGRRIDHGERTIQAKERRCWRTREDPLLAVWEQVVRLLEDNPALLPITIYDYLCEQDGAIIDTRFKRTLQRRIKHWKATQGPAKEVIFRQSKQPARLGLSDFTELKGITITIAGEALLHRLYHYRLAYSGWSYVKVILGGESFTALSTGLQEALWRSGGAPEEHRTDSLSAAYHNLAEQEQLTVRYEGLCRHYGMRGSRNNPGQSHENGAIESPHGHFKRRLQQTLMLRGNHDFDSLQAYQGLIDALIAKYNRQCESRFKEEQGLLNPLPKRRTHDYAELYLIVTSSSTIDIKRVTYSVPSQLIGEKICVHLYDDHLDLYCGHQEVYRTVRVYAPKSHRGRCINYRHVIHSLVRKPQAFRYSQLRDDLLPNEDYRLIWTYVDRALQPREACRYIVKLLHCAAQYACEQALGRYVWRQIQQGHLPTETDYRARYVPSSCVYPPIASRQHDLAGYDQLLDTRAEVMHV